jgi:predicted GH43/DUF377 family glycosyl hydrolase
MQWRKLGLLYGPRGERDWALSHAMPPTPLLLSDDVVRLYVAHADENTVGRVGYLDVALADPARVLALAEQPVLDIGEPGTFDDNGVSPCCMVPCGGTLRMYYAGIQLQRKIPYTLFIGLATAAHPDGPFTRVSGAPILDRVDGEMFFRTAPFVMQDGGLWRMWYIAGSGWVQGNEKELPHYSLHHIVSDDGVTWSGRGTECLAPREPDEIGFGRPFIIRQGVQYRMWYSIRTIAGYRLGYATSPDGLRWTRRDDEVGIGLSQAGWDSEMLCFAAVVAHRGRWLMFYNGNGNGRTGVGVAVSEAG